MRVLWGLLVALLVCTTAWAGEGQESASGGGVATTPIVIPEIIASPAEVTGDEITITAERSVVVDTEGAAQLARLGELTLQAREAILILRPLTDPLWAEELASLIADNILWCEAEHGVTVDPDLAVALCCIESGFNPRASNWSTDCFGLWQVRYPVHKGTYRLTSYKQLYEPERCTRCGFDILGSYTKRTGSVEGGLRRYGTKVYGSERRPGVMTLYNKIKRARSERAKA